MKVSETFLLKPFTSALSCDILSCMNNNTATIKATAADLIVGDHFRHYYDTHNVNLKTGTWTPTQDSISGTVGSITIGSESSLNKNQIGRIQIATTKRSTYSLAPTDAVTITREVK